MMVGGCDKQIVHLFLVRTQKVKSERQIIRAALLFTSWTNVLHAGESLLFMQVN